MISCNGSYLRIAACTLGVLGAGLAGSALAQSSSAVKGNNVTFGMCREGDSAQQYMLTGGRTWVRHHKNGAEVTGTEVSRDEWSVYIQFPQEKMQLDLWKKQCVNQNTGATGQLTNVDAIKLNY